MYFNTKKDLLIYLGKDQKDVRLVERMIKRGDVVRDANGYDLIKNEIRDLNDIKEIENLRARVSELEGMLENKDYNPTELEEAKIQWSYFEGEYRRMCVMCNKIIHATYEKHRNYYQKFNVDEAEYKRQIVDYVKSN